VRYEGSAALRQDRAEADTDGMGGAVSAGGTVDREPGRPSRPRPVPRVPRRLARRRAVGAVLSAAVVHLLLQAAPLALTPGYSVAGFRRYFPYDQLSYLAIAVNARHGSVAAVEPFTETGSNYYPRLYYQVMGLLARLFRADTVSVWTVLGLVVQVVLVVAVGTACVVLTRRWWTGVLGALPFVIGTFSTSTSSSGNWYSVLDSHGVLWGAYGVLFTLNGEAASLCLAGVALLALLIVATGHVRGRAAAVTAVLALGLIGALANVQTYSFLTAVYLVVFTGGVLGLVRARSALLVAVSVVLLAALLVAGPTLASGAGPLATLVAGAVPAVPGLLVLLRGHRVPVLLGALAAGLTASPTVVSTVLGVAGNDPFLVYRDSSSSNLGVPVWTGVRAGAVLLVALALVLVAGEHKRRPVWFATAAGAGLAWALVSTNDRWGANQEPYRFWIDGFTLIATVLVPLGAMVAAEYLGSRAQTAKASSIEATRALGALAPRVLAASALALVLVMIGVASEDFVGFTRYVRAGGLISFDTPQARAMPTALEMGAADGLVLPDPCVDPFTLKAVTGARVAFYNLGLAWPQEEPPMRQLLAARSMGTLDVDAARAAGVTEVLVDSTCAASWPGTGLTRLGAVDYGTAGANLQLWRF